MFRSSPQQDADWTPRFVDEAGRFRVWAGNISAHRTARRSLEYRLRDSSNLKATVESLLRNLSQALLIVTRQSLIAMRAPLAPIINASDREPSASPQTHDDSSTSGGGGDDDMFEIEDDEVGELLGPLEQALDEVHEVITLLLRFSMTLRSPAKHDQMRQAATSNAKYYEVVYGRHLQEKYPHVPSFLASRIGKAMSKHRGYLGYREQHHEKLAAGLDDDTETVGDRPSIVATSLRDVQAVQAVSRDSDSESIYTATSFAMTLSHTVTLRPTPLPDAGQDGEPFECPICFGIVVALDERSWR